MLVEQLLLLRAHLGQLILQVLSQHLSRQLQHIYNMIIILKHTQMQIYNLTNKQKCHRTYTKIHRKTSNANTGKFGNLSSLIE